MSALRNQSFVGLHYLCIKRIWTIKLNLKGREVLMMKNLLIILTLIGCHFGSIASLELRPEIDQASLKQEVINKSKRLLPCYRKFIKHKNKVKIKLSWDILENGNVKYLSIENSNTRNKSFKQCILKKMSTWKFKKTKKSIVMTYPFEFSNI
jgi:hypothetical protein